MGRRWGQHFLRDRRVVEKILDAADLGPEDQVLEVGPGPGAMTVPMCERAGRVVAFEIDPQWAEKLPANPNLRVVGGDFLKADLRAELGSGPWKVVANLPYYITGPILEKLFFEGQGLVTDMWLMMQKEVAVRLTSPATREAGSLTYFAAYFCHPKLLFKVKPGSFAPPPEVDSAVVHLHMREEPLECDRDRLFRLVRQAFSMRRKTLHRSLRGLLEEPGAVLEKAGISGQRRPETLSLEEFIRVERAWE
ncbi:MAG: ribosomal RNA small subunit methyltransferase A [Candidatus Eremiobacteraeota bacterium]|nr:ribosomal RNA small subunit methyltransferase A [Candidatus Eremiobacteraeota bacterium]